MTNNLFLVLILLNLTFVFSLEARQAEQKEKTDSTFLQSTIRFDNSSLKKIVLYPETILDNPQSFWDNDPAYKLYKLWHQFVSYPVDMEQWKKNLQSYVDIPNNERHQNSQLIISQKSLNKEETDYFNERAIPYLYSFLPKDCPPIDATIYFTTAILPNGFQMGNDVVIYGENSDKENLFIHELFHRCQRACETISDKKESNNPELDQIYLLLWIEGTATYAGYKALYEFQAVDPLLQNDYKLLEDTMNIIQLRNKLNVLYESKASNLINKNELQTKLIQTGIIDRAFYIVGFDMASVIDDKLGRDVLKETLLHGPDYFIQKYNSVVSDADKIFDFYSIGKIQY
ncbi:MAG TPA: DUF5700 domain-containing putative Zn-dependent protease [Draconibacterium sp.]|nr:DUF5700 domain-containing putative Zn-dependent protease [Draconibacterium sp.]